MTPAPVRFSPGKGPPRGDPGGHPGRVSPPNTRQAQKAPFSHSSALSSGSSVSSRWMSEVRCRWGSSASSHLSALPYCGSGLGLCGKMEKGDKYMANNCSDNCSGKGSAETIGLHEIEEDGTEERCCGTCWWEDRRSCICCHEKCERNLQRVGEADSGCGLWASRGPYR